MALKRRTGAVGDKRHTMLVAVGRQPGHFFGALGKHHSVGQHGRVRRFVPPMMLAHGLGCRKPIAETFAQGLEETSRNTAPAARNGNGTHAFLSFLILRTHRRVRSPACDRSERGLVTILTVLGSTAD